jgi:hypothetical protein
MRDDNGACIFAVPMRVRRRFASAKRNASKRKATIRQEGIMVAKKTGAPAADAFALARAAGLHKAVKQFPDDIVAAAHGAVSAREALGAQENVAAEPWPPMRVRSSS